MRVSRGWALAALAVGFLMFSTSSGWAQSAKAYIGTYTLVSVKVQQGGKTVEPFGPHPMGYYVLDAHGHFAVLLMRPGLPKFAADNRLKGTPEENEAVVQGSLAYFGTYTINGKTLTLKIEGSTFPNWAGTEQKRSLALRGDELTTATVAASVGGAATAVWKRVK